MNFTFVFYSVAITGVQSNWGGVFCKAYLTINAKYTILNMQSGLCKKIIKDGGCENENTGTEKTA